MVCPYLLKFVTTFILFPLWFAKNKDKWEETFVVICWTQYTREELWNDVMGEYETQQFQSTDLDKREGKWFGEQADEMLIQSDADLKPTKKWWETYLINFYNFDKRSQNMIRQIIFLQSFLNQYQKKLKKLHI